MSDIWVTGAQGFIGKHLSKALGKQGYSVHGIGNGKWGKNEQIKWGLNSWSDSHICYSSLNNFAENTGSPSRIYHFAGGSSVGNSVIDPYLDFNRSVASTMELLEWVRKNCEYVPVVVASSVAVFGANAKDPIDESTAIKPFSPYGYHKAMVENICEYYSRTYGISLIVTRLFSVFGPQLRKQLIWDFTRKLLSSKGAIELNGTGNELRDWSDVRDLSFYLSSMPIDLENNFSVRNVASGQIASTKKITDIVLDAMGEAREVVFNGISRPGDPERLISDINYKDYSTNIPLVDGIRDYVTWIEKALR